MMSFKNASHVATVMFVVLGFTSFGLMFDSFGYYAHVDFYKTDACVSMPVLGYGSQASTYTACPPPIGFGFFTMMGIGVFVLTLTRLLIGVEKDELAKTTGQKEIPHAPKK